MLLANPYEFSRYLTKARATKLPMTVKEILPTDDDNVVAIMVGFADGTEGACLVPMDLLTMENIKVSAAMLAAVWEALRPPPVYKKKDIDEVIDLDG